MGSLFAMVDPGVDPARCYGLDSSAYACFGLLSICTEYVQLTLANQAILELLFDVQKKRVAAY